MYSISNDKRREYSSYNILNKKAACNKNKSNEDNSVSFNVSISTYRTDNSKEVNDFWDDLKRQKRAITSNFKIIENKGNEFTIQSGEKIYATSDKSCSCPDYQDRRKTCKHMYFVLHLLKKFNLFWGLPWNSSNEQIVNAMESPSYEKLKRGLNKKNIVDQLNQQGVLGQYINIVNISVKFGNILKEFLFYEPINAKERLAKIDIEVNEKTHKNQILNLLISNFPEFVNSLKENYYIIDYIILSDEAESYLYRKFFTQKMHSNMNITLRQQYDSMLNERFPSHPSSKS